MPTLSYSNTTPPPSNAVVGNDEITLRVVRGSFTTTGAVASITRGAGFSLVRNGAGDVTVTFTTPFSATPSVVVGLGPGTALVTVELYSATAPSVSTFRTLLQQVSPNVLVDGPVEFIAVGPR